jgi:hypothetical protein
MKKLIAHNVHAQCNPQQGTLRIRSFDKSDSSQVTNSMFCRILPRCSNVLVLVLLPYMSELVLAQCTRLIVFQQAPQQLTSQCIVFTLNRMYNNPLRARTMPNAELVCEILPE